MKTEKEYLADAQEIIRQKNQELLVANKTIRLLRRDNDLADDIKKEIFEYAGMTRKPPTWLIKPNKPDLPGVPMTIWSDWHWGETVYANQVGGVNEFNERVAKERVRRLVQHTVDLTIRHMVRPSYPGLVLCLGGDFVTGAIHEELARNVWEPVQCSCLAVEEQLIWAIQTLHNEFGKLYIPCVVGNHGRNSIKPVFKNRTYENYEWRIYQGLRRHFRNNDDIYFDIPEEVDAYFNVLGHRFLLHHGDCLGVRGGDGIIGAIGPITRGAIKVGRSEAQIGRDFDTLVIGHWHIYIPRGDATPVIVNGSLIGYNEYGRLQLRVPYSRPTHALWFMHQVHGLTAQWPIYLDGLRQARNFNDWVSCWRKK